MSGTRLPRHQRTRLWPTRLAMAIHRAFVPIEYDPGRPWYLIQSAADAQAQSQLEDVDARAQACCRPIDPHTTILPSEAAREAEQCRQDTFWDNFYRAIGGKSVSLA